VYRSEMKKILINQINLIKIVIHIIERLMKGMTLDFAVTRVFELESKKEFIVNRMMIDNYLTSLKNGLAKNQREYLELHKGKNPSLTDDDQAKQDILEHQRALRLELPKVAYRQFEVRGYDKMIERILEAPIRSSQAAQNKELEERLLMIKDSLSEQANKNAMRENQYQMEREEEEVKRQDVDGEESEYGEEEGESYYDEEDDENEAKKEVIPE